MFSQFIKSSKASSTLLLLNFTNFGYISFFDKPTIPSRSNSSYTSLSEIMPLGLKYRSKSSIVFIYLLFIIISSVSIFTSVSICLFSEYFSNGVSVYTEFSFFFFSSSFTMSAVDFRSD